MSCSNLCCENGYPSHASEWSAHSGSRATSSRRGKSAEGLRTNFGESLQAGEVDHASAIVAASSILLPMLRSDASLWASVLRVEGVRSEVIAMHITLAWRHYREAERMRNAFALRGIVDDLQNLLQEYASLNDGRELPFRPCP
jgi:hypothetical protein